MPPKPTVPTKPSAWGRVTGLSSAKPPANNPYEDDILSMDEEEAARKAIIRIR